MIPGLPAIGGMEILILLAVILLFFGAKRIPDLARSLGKGTREFRKGISEGASSEDETQEKDREKLPLNEAADNESSRRVETKSVRAEQKT